MKKGYGAPKSTTMGEVGEKYLDLSTGEVYECTEVSPTERDMGFISTYELYNAKFTWVKSSGGGDWDTLKNRPFYKEKVPAPLVVEWDGSAVGKPAYKNGMDSGLCMVSDAIIEDYHDLIGHTAYWTNGNHETPEAFVLTEDSYGDHPGIWGNSVEGYRFDGFGFNQNLSIGIVTKSEDPSYPAGIYFAWSGGDHIAIFDTGLMTEKEVVNLDIETRTDETPVLLNVVTPEYDSDYTEGGEYYIRTPECYDFKVGAEYRVVIDDVVYICEAVDDPKSNDTFAYLGNMSLADASYEDTGEPFLLWSRGPWSAFTLWIAAEKDSVTASTHTISVYEYRGEDSVLVNPVWFPGLMVNVYATVDNNGNVTGATADYDFATILGCLNASVMVSVKVTFSDDGCNSLILTQCDFNKNCICFAYPNNSFYVEFYKDRTIGAYYD